MIELQFPVLGQSLPEYCESPLGIEEGNKVHALYRLWLCAQRLLASVIASTYAIGISQHFTKLVVRLVKMQDVVNDSYKRSFMQLNSPVRPAARQPALSEESTQRLVEALRIFANSKRVRYFAQVLGLETEDFMDDAYLHLVQNARFRRILAEEGNSRQLQLLVNHWALYYVHNHVNREGRWRQRHPNGDVEEFDRLGVSLRQTRTARRTTRPRRVLPMPRPANGYGSDETDIGQEFSPFLSVLPSKLSACVRERLAGFTVSQIAERKSVTRRTIYNWLSSAARLLGIRPEGKASA